MIKCQNLFSRADLNEVSEFTYSTTATNGDKLKIWHAHNFCTIATFLPKLVPYTYYLFPVQSSGPGQSGCGCLPEWKSVIKVVQFSFILYLSRLIFGMDREPAICCVWGVRLAGWLVGLLVVSSFLKLIKLSISLLHPASQQTNDQTMKHATL